MTIHAGTILRKKYLLIKPLGSGSFATVWLSYNIPNKNFVAIKVQNPEDIEYAFDEIELFKKVSTNVCKYLNKTIDDFIITIDDDQYACMVFELMAGTTYDIIQKGKYVHGLHINAVKKIIYQILLAIDALNNKYKKIHTDIKPENILLVGTSNSVQNIINEFGKINFPAIVNKTRGEIIKKYKGKKINNIDDIILQAAGAEVINKLKLPKDIHSESESDSHYHSDNEDRNDYENEYESDYSESEGSVTIEHMCNKDPRRHRKCKYSNEIIIDEKYIDPSKIEVRLSDFGTCCDLNYNLYDIQTRYYRAPEIILNYPYNETCDIWSTACVMYELLTGEILFDPRKRKGFSRDRHHVYDMQCMLGKIPDYLLDKAKKKKLFFKNNGLIKGQWSIHYTPLSELLINKLKGRTDIGKSNMTLLIDLLYKMLNYDPSKRITAKDCLKHDFFKT